MGPHLLRGLARGKGVQTVLGRRPPFARLNFLIEDSGWTGRVEPLHGDITKPELGIEADPHFLEKADIFHLAAVYDLEASEEDNQRANVEGTSNVVALAHRIGARVHHMSSIAVAGARWKGKF